VNPQEYILSGIIESYVLGITSPEDSAEFERMCDAHQEVRAARNSFELQLEQYLLQQKMQPPRALKSRIFSEIGMEKDEQTPRIISEKPILIPRKGFARYVAAVSLILLLGSVLLNLYLLNQYKKSIAQYKDLVATQTQIVGANQIIQTKLETYENALSLMKNPLMAIVKMPGAPLSPAPSSMATVYWNTESKEVYLLVNQLPMPVPDKQYQLWAIVDGHPVNAGIFDMDKDLSFVKLKTIPKAEAFAITLEKKGGSTTPTMDAMYVMGKVTG
jgi:anti-sigma-K factor RskA